MEIKEIRKISGLSQDKFCRMYNIPTSTLQHWERGATAAPPYVLELLERVVKEDFEKEPE